MKIILPLLIFLIKSSSIIACICFEIKKESKERLDKEYSFIALVHVKQLMPNKYNVQGRYDILIDTKEIYKGYSLDTLTVNSYHPNFQLGKDKITSSSCDILLENGTDYLVLGRIQGKETTIGSCSILSLKKVKLDDYGENSSFAFIDSLRKFYNIRVEPPIQNGIYRTCYPDGKIKSEENYKDGLKHGKLKRFRPDGKNYIEENYKKGKLDGTQIRTNTINSYVINFENGIKSGTAKYYYTNGKVYMKEKHSINIGLVSGQAFDEKGNLDYDFIKNPVTKISEERRYEEGKVKETWRCDENGKKIDY